MSKLTLGKWIAAQSDTVLTNLSTSNDWTAFGFTRGIRHQMGPDFKPIDGTVEQAGCLVENAGLTKGGQAVGGEKLSLSIIWNRFDEMARRFGERMGMAPSAIARKRGPHIDRLGRLVRIKATRVLLERKSEVADLEPAMREMVHDLREIGMEVHVL